MDWSNGKLLSSMKKGSQTLAFAYGEGGLRTGKTVTQGSTAKTYKYLWDGSRLVAQLGEEEFFFCYDGSGNMTGYTYVDSKGKETECLFVKNLQGDVERVIDLAGNVLASYTYDAWGNLLASSGSLASLNPIRYRGYYYDSETALYYLQSRYYDPAVGRFLNADTFESTGQGVLGCNMFAYCLNNPVNYVDKDGEDAALAAEWLLTGSWLCVADGPIPLGDILFLAVLGTLYICETTEPCIQDHVVYDNKFQLPSWKKVKVDIGHIYRRHTLRGTQDPNGKKSKWPDWMTTAKIMKAIEEAYKHAQKVGEKVLQDGEEVKSSLVGLMIY